MRAPWSDLKRRAAMVAVAMGTLISLTPGLRAAPAKQDARPLEQITRLETVAPVETIRVGAFDESRAPITGLSQADFVVSEDGEQREVIAVDGVEDAPVDVVLVLGPA